jgi:hypothetical protein
VYSSNDNGRGGTNNLLFPTVNTQYNWLAEPDERVKQVVQSKTAHPGDSKQFVVDCEWIFCKEQDVSKRKGCY